MGLTLRSVKGSELTFDEMDNNFIFVSNKNAISDTTPTNTDDESKGFIVGSEWLDTTDFKKYRCTDSTADNAVWSEIQYGVTTFVELSDTAGTLEAYKTLAVNADATAVELIETPLKIIDEGNGKGYARDFLNRGYFRNIGLSAIDFSYSDDDNNEMGAGGSYSLAFGFNNKTNRPKDVILGQDNSSLYDENNDEPNYGHNIITGYGNTLNNDDSYFNIINGANITATAQFSFINGDSHSVTTSNYNAINGSANTLNSALFCFVNGGANTVEQSFNIVNGDNNTITHSRTLVLGTGLKTAQDNQTLFGKYNDDSRSDIAFAIGNGADNDNRSNLIEIKTDGVIFIDKMVGITDDRPTLDKASSFPYFDTTLGYPIWYNGSDWVDATGTVV